MTVASVTSAANTADVVLREVGVKLLKVPMLGVLLIMWASLVSAQDRREPVRVLTSFPPTLFEPFRAEFEKRYPEFTVEVLQRKTAAALSNTTGSRAPRADIFWASAPDAFELLKIAGRLAPTRPRATGAPDTVAGYPVNDPDHSYLGFAMSGYGLVYNPRYLSDRGLPVPATWEDLARPVYAGHVGISSPSRSGTTHLVVEALLQARGWTEGWALLSAIGGNLATVTARSFGVTAGVARARFGMGISIDFLVRSSNSTADAVAFVLLREAIFAPASIAILADAQNRPGAEAFVDFVLSPDGQALLLRPEIGRIPVSPTVRSSSIALRGAPESEGPLGRSRFDAALSARRYELVNILFDEMITLRRAQLVELWRRIRTLERALGERPNSGAQAALRRARGALERPPAPEMVTRDPDLLAAVARIPRGLPSSEIQSRWEAELRRALEQSTAEAAGALREAEAMLTGLGASQE